MGTIGPLTGVPNGACWISDLAMSPHAISKNVHVDLNSLMLKLRNDPCHVTNISPMSMGFISHVDLRK